MATFRLTTEHDDFWITRIVQLVLSPPQRLSVTFDTSHIDPLPDKLHEGRRNTFSDLIVFFLPVTHSLHSLNDRTRSLVPSEKKKMKTKIAAE